MAGKSVFDGIILLILRYNQLVICSPFLGTVMRLFRDVIGGCTGSAKKAAFYRSGKFGLHLNE
jgi:hypothetical protein